jgi:hypothetical protein
LNLNQNKTMKKYLLTIALTAAAVLSASSLRAQDTNTPAPAPAPAPATTNAVAIVTMQTLPSSELSMEQRKTSMKTYVANAAPTIPFKDAKVFVSNAGQAIRIRTEEKGDSAV